MHIPALSSAKSQEKDKTAGGVLNSFIGTSPSSVYRFTAPRDAPGAEICRGEGPGEECRTMDMTGKEMFALMQKLGFFCAMPIDPGKTYMECTPAAIPKS